MLKLTKNVNSDLQKTNKKCVINDENLAFISGAGHYDPGSATPSILDFNHHRHPNNQNQYVYRGPSNNRI
uniref:hypothetical protein n=1 Tax=Ningiella ruwaisensis TaxID=2364274 RepID=UPI0010A0A915|nr:hypothetical protein [Ningiella ruwaisensis]